MAVISRPPEGEGGQPREQLDKYTRKSVVACCYQFHYSEFL